jgi:Carboxypeptidase regulatory-like domain
MRALLICALAGLGALAVPVSAPADGNTGIVRGTVTLPDGTPACGVHVRVLSRYEANWSTQTDSNGQYVFLSILPGEVAVEFAGIRTERTDPDDDAFLNTQRYAHVSANLSTDIDATVPDPPSLGLLRPRSAPGGWRETQQRCAPADARYALFSGYQTF